MTLPSVPFALRAPAVQDRVGHRGSDVQGNVGCDFAAQEGVWRLVASPTLHGRSDPRHVLTFFLY